ncbi:MAG: TauD/TfdA family dioxygenase [Alphaproteobacteria bacterium]|jgi:taurine dioxygenase|nr:TauD/TfdA family dioxygenase [Alphaproteobacteria bacterium]
MAMPTSDADRPFELRPLSAALGAEVLGLDLNEALDDDCFAAIHRAFLDHQLLIFRDQQLSPGAQVVFARRFGEVQVHLLSQYHEGGHPELYTLSNLDENGAPSGRHPDKGTLAWHSDNSWSREASQATLLYVEVAPKSGGGTQFADMYGAYEALAADERSEVTDLRAVHDVNYSRNRRHGEDPLTDEQRRAKPPVDHPIVRTHPETRRKCLYLGDHASHIQGWPVDEGRAFVEALNGRIVRPQLVYEHAWRPGDLAVWDNRCCLHKALPYDTARDRRVIRRCTVLGSEPPY